MNKIKKVVSLLLTVCLLLAMSVPTFAAGLEKKYKNYNTYMCIGDSIAAGCGLSKDHPGVDTEFDCPYEAGTPEYTAYIADMYSMESTMIYRGYNFDERVPYSYHDLVTTGLGLDDDGLIQASRCGLRTVELRYFLEGNYTAPDTSWSETYFTYGDEFGFDDLDYVRDMFNYDENIKKADLISLNLGSNDVLSPTFANAYTKLTEVFKDTDIMTQLEKIEQENAGNPLAIAVEGIDFIASTLDNVSVVYKYLNEEFDKNFSLYKDNYAFILEEIYRLNPNTTIVGVGTYNFFQDMKLSKDSKVQISLVSALYVNKVNRFIKSFEDKYTNQYYYANVMGAETYEVLYDDPNMWDLWIFKVHPTVAGYKLMADRILNCLPCASIPDGELGSTLTYWYRKIALLPKLIDFVRSWLPYITQSPIMPK